MELSVPVGSSLAMAAAMGLVNPKMTCQTFPGWLPSQRRFAHRLPSLACSMMFNKQFSQGTNRKVCSLLQAVSPLQCTESPTQPSVSFEDFHVSVSTEEDGVINMRVSVAGTMTDSIFEKVFTKKVAAAQPLPGFRRMKGVKKETIAKIISCTIAECVQKEGLNASKNLKVQQSYEELEAAFEPGKEFCFDAALHQQ